MNALESIAENRLYFPQSLLSINCSEKNKTIVQEYTQERENILRLVEKNFKIEIN